jgi:hypothetical protein
MRLAITVEFNSGESETYIAQPPEFIKWESKTGYTIQQAGEKMGITDFAFLAYHAMKSATPEVKRLNLSRLGRNL